MILFFRKEFNIKLYYILNCNKKCNISIYIYIAHIVKYNII